MFNHHKVQICTIAWGGNLHGRFASEHWNFYLDGEDKIQRMNPLRVSPCSDSTREWLQPKAWDYGTSARQIDQDSKKSNNRTQKGIYQSQ